MFPSCPCLFLCGPVQITCTQTIADLSVDVLPSFNKCDVKEMCVSDCRQLLRVVKKTAFNQVKMLRSVS